MVTCILLDMAAVLVVLVFCLVASSNSGLVKAVDHGVANPSVGDNESMVVTLDKSQYCFVNVDTIKVSTNNNNNNNMTTGYIIDATEEMIIATNVNNTIIMTAPANGSWCSDDKLEETYFTIELYIIQMIILVCITLAAISNIGLHLLYKELRTVLGILIMTLCGSVTVAAVILIGKTTYRIIYGANESIVLCVLSLYVLIVLLFLYQATKLTILYHFFNLMYQNYKMRPAEPDVVKCSLVKYVSFIIASSILCALSMALIDFAVNGEVYDAKERWYCIFEATEFGGVHHKIFHGEMAVFILLEIILSTSGFFFYAIVSKKCCQKKSMNVKVAIALITIVGINIIMNTILGIFYCPMNVILPAVTSGTLLEQVILLMLFSSSSKVCASSCIHVV